MPRLTPIETLYGEVCALQLVVQRLVAQEAVASGYDMQKVLRAEHGQASEELKQMRLITDQPERAHLILSHAQAVIDQIYSVASTTKRPSE